MRRILGGRHFLFAGFQPAERDLDSLRLAVTQDLDRHRLADRAFRHRTGQFPRFIDLVAIEDNNDIAGFQQPAIGRAALDDGRNQHTARLVHTETFGNVVSHRLDADTQEAAPRLAELPQLINYPGSQFGRNGKADADRTAGRRNDRGVDADDLAIHVEQRPAGIAAVDGRIRLDEAVIRPGINVSVLGRNDADRHGATQAERVADGHDPIADARLFGIAELDCRQFFLGRIDLENGQVGLLVATDERCLQ